MPLANSLVGIVDGSNIYLGVKMSDGSKRVVSFDGSYPLGTLVADGDDGFNFNCVASPGVQEQQPAVVPFRFSSTAQTAPAGYETLSAELVFTSYTYDPEEALASWLADMYVSDVKQIDSIHNGDHNITASGEPIAVEGDVQIFGDSNCLTYPSGVLDIVYARVNRPWGFNGGWNVGDDIKCLAPSDESPDDAYQIVWYIDWFSEQETQPYVAGQVITLDTSDPYEITDPICIFTKP